MRKEIRFAAISNARRGGSLSTAKGLRITKTTLQKLATTGGGPDYAIFGNRALSTVEQLDRWAKSKLKPRCSTSEAA